MAKFTLRIDYDDTTKALVVTAGASAPFAGDKAARVSFALNFDPAHPTPAIKRREGEDDAAYQVRVGKHIPAVLDLDPAYAAGLAERCAEIIEAVRDVGEHYSALAAAQHTLAAQGKAAPGVKAVAVGGALGATGGAKV
jgi:hypothetical protein